MNKEIEYKKLIKKRKSKKTTIALIKMGLFNYSQFPYKNEFVDGYEQWHSDLDADIMLVAQDYADWKSYVKENSGEEKIKGKFNITTNIHLSELFVILNAKYEINPLKLNQRKSKLFFTNAVIGLKGGNMQAKTEKNWAEYGTAKFLKSLIAIVEPKNIIALGQESFNAICHTYNIKKSGTFMEIVEGKPYKIPEKNINLFAVYHCGGRGVSTNRSLKKQKEDWKKIKENILK